MKKKLPVEQALIQSITDARNFEAGKKKLKIHTCEIPDNPQVLHCSNLHIRTMNATKNNEIIKAKNLRKGRRLPAS